jgi:hypothetical protein
MSEQVITDRAEALRLAPDEADEGSRRAAPVTRPVKVSPASSHPPGDRVACPWCGAFSCPDRVVTPAARLSPWAFPRGRLLLGKKQ